MFSANSVLVPRYRFRTNKVLRDPEFNAYVMKMAESKGLVRVNLAVAGRNRLYFGVKRPLLSNLADFQGLKLLRVNATPAERATHDPTLSANCGTNGSAGDDYFAAERVIDGTHASDGILDLHELQPAERGQDALWGPTFRS